MTKTLNQIKGKPLKFDSLISLKVLGLYLKNFAVELLGVKPSKKKKKKKFILALDPKSSIG
jgi:hypothetical protein